MWAILALTTWFVVVKRVAFPTFQESSDVLVAQVIESASKGTLPNRWLGLVGPENSTYSSQFGLQGLVFSLPARVGFPNGPTYEIAVWVLSALLFATIAVAFAKAADKIFGPPVGKWIVAFLFLSPWLILMADSPYWMIGLLIWPFVFSWTGYKTVAAAGHGRLWFFGGVAMLVCLKALCGYEYITNVVLSVLVAIVFWEVRYGQSIGRIALSGTAAVLAGTVGFVLAIGMHAAELRWHTGSWVAAKEAILDRAIARGSLSKYSKSDGGVIVPADATWLEAILPYFGAGRPRVVINNAELTEQKRMVYTDPKVGQFAKVSGFVNLVLFLTAISTIVCAFWLAKKLKARGALNEFKQLHALSWAAMIAVPISFSWSVAAFRHMYYHWHLNYITFYVPMYLTAFALFAAWIAMRNAQAPDREALSTLQEER